MRKYDKSGAREWARANLKGLANVTIPSFSADLRKLNEVAIRHDIELNVSNGFGGTLLVSEVVISPAEYGRFCAVADEQSAGRIQLIYHAAFSTLADNIECAQLAQANGASLVLLTYPPSFYAESEQDIYEHSRAFCDATDLAVMLFPLPTWGFGRVHTSDISVTLLRRLIDDCPNIVAIKAEGGYPNVMGYIECYRRFGEQVVISCPIEGDMIPLSQIMPIQYSSTSNTEYYGPLMPSIFTLLQAGHYEEATQLYWKIHPARKANAAAAATWGATGLINRLQWKYQAWLNGYNGGALRHPTMRVSDELMRGLRQGLVKSGLPVTETADREFLTGRNPL